MMEIIPQLEKRTPYIALFANVATLLGLLGTITGLIAAFTAPRSIAVGATIVALSLTLVLFIHHVTDPLKLSF